MANWLILSIGILLGAIGVLVVVMVSSTVAIIQAEQKRKKQTTNTEAGLLDAMADLNYAEFDLIEIQGRIDTALRKMEMAKRRQSVIRSGPYAYPKDGRLEDDGENSL